MQAETKDIVVAVKEIDGVIMTLLNVRTSIETYLHSQWFTVVEKMCADVGTVPAIHMNLLRFMNLPRCTKMTFHHRIVLAAS